MDMRPESLPEVRAPVFTRTLDVSEPDAIDYVGGPAGNAALEAGVEPSGPLL